MTPDDQARFLLKWAYHEGEIPSEEMDEILELLGTWLPLPNELNSRRADLETYALKQWIWPVKQGIQKLERGRAWGFSVSTHYNFWVPLPWQGQAYRPRQKRFTKPIPHQGVLTKTRRDDCAHKLAEIFEAVADKLRRRPGCGAIFVKRARQIYCTPKCAN